jgi:hypothetical protein
MLCQFLLLFQRPQVQHSPLVVPSGTIVVSTQSGVEYSVNGTTYQSSNTFSGLTRMAIHCMLEIWPMLPVTMSSSTTTITVPLPLFQRHQLQFSLLVVPSGISTISTQSGVEYSVNGTAYQSSNSFQAAQVILYVRNLADPVV